MLRIIVWCLPVEKEAAYNRLHQALVEIAKKAKALGVEGEDDMLCLFPGDLMEYGLGQEIVFEAKGRCLTRLSNPMGKRLAKAWGGAIKQLYPDANIEGEVRTSSGLAYWSSREEE